MDDYITAHQVSVGTQIEPIQRIKIMSADEWETLIEEWLDTKTNKYLKIEKMGGAGDMGRDVIAYINNPKDHPTNYQWDCYQCKHYSQSLAPSHIWVELGKIIYYSFNKEYPVPNQYYFVAPQGVGTSLSNLLDNPQKLKLSLKKNWEKYCENEISNKSIKLSGSLLKYFDNFNFNFSIFDKQLPKNIVNDHKKHHKNHLLRFGGGLPNRKTSVNIPPLSQESNLRYINQLTKAYNSDSSNHIEKAVSIIGSKYENHFQRSRKSFYSAEELRLFTRDNLPVEVYDKFKDDIFDSVINIAEENFDKNGFSKLKTVENQASKTTIESNPIREVCQTIDKKGVCHQLVNEKQLTWVDDE
mgnify:CR=1 FL=1